MHAAITKVYYTVKDALNKVQLQGYLDKLSKSTKCKVIVCDSCVLMLISVKYFTLGKTMNSKIIDKMTWLQDEKRSKGLAWKNASFCGQGAEVI
jgi:hypothetical protein